MTAFCTVKRIKKKRDKQRNPGVIKDHVKLHMFQIAMVVLDTRS